MSRKILNWKHHLASGCCMWSGIEDLYASRTNQDVPEAFFFTISSFGETVFIKTGEKEIPFMFSIGDGRTRKTYDRIKNMIGLQYKISEGRTLSYALSMVKKEIDNGNPVILGPLDMYHLPYLKMYHQEHIPMHYVTMTGYDEDRKCVYIYDCDRTDRLELPEEELIKAWQIEKNAVGDKNGFIRFSIAESLPDKYELAKQCMALKAERQLCIKPSFIGVNAYQKLVESLKAYQKLPREEYKKLLVSLTEWMGMVPKLPNAIMGVSGDDILYQGNYNRLHNLLVEMGTACEDEDWIMAGRHFQICGTNIETIVGHIITFYLEDKDCTEIIQKLLLDTGMHAKAAYELLYQKGGITHGI